MGSNPIEPISIECLMRIHHIAISVRDLEKSIAFYTEHFGFEEINRFSKPDWDGEAAILQLGEMQLEIFGFNDCDGSPLQDTNLKRIGLNHISVQVDNVHEKHKELLEKGVSIDAPVKGTTCIAFCFLRDPDGVSIELYER